MIACQTLEGLPAEIVYQTFMDAFSDYHVKIEMTAQEFDRANIRRGYSPEYSAAAFFEGRCVGILMKGLRLSDGQLTAYDMGTGVIPAFRQSGVTTRMMNFVREKMDAGNVTQYVLEVIQDNEPALNFYRKQKFEIAREFCGYRASRLNFSSKNNHRVERIRQPDWTLFRSFWDFAPSWQNSEDSVNAIGDHFRYYAAFDHAEIAGYLIADVQSGEIVQFAVRKDVRNKGFGTELFRAAGREIQSEYSSILNVEAGKTETQIFLASLGFVCTLRQYEMIRTLRRAVIA